MNNPPHRLVRDLSRALARISGADSDVDRFNQLQFTHSKYITGLRSRSACWTCFIDEYELDREIVRSIYTGDEIFQKLNLALCNGTGDRAIKMYTQLLCEAIYRIHEPLPYQVFRGVMYSDALVSLYSRCRGHVIYYYSFTSTSRDLGCADQFGRAKGGWLLSIQLQKGNRNCVADVSMVSRYSEEQEILISCNAGFEILDVNHTTRTISLRLVDEERCPAALPNKKCRAHA